MEVHNWNEQEDGPVSEEAMREKFEEMGYVVSRFEYSPGTTFPAHTHGVEKIDAVLEGRFRMTMGGDEAILERGDWVVVPESALHTAEVVGDQTVVSLDATKR
ncbi:MAG: cupin domain-containing protein [Bradymonadaceae bacterium]